MDQPDASSRGVCQGTRRLFEASRSGILFSERLLKKEAMTDVILPEGAYSDTLADVVVLLEEGRQTAARSINALMTATYWLVGRRIVETEQGGQGRAAYGQAL